MCGAHASRKATANTHLQHAIEVEVQGGVAERPASAVCQRYMVPAALLKMEALPRLGNGKVSVFLATVWVLWDFNVIPPWKGRPGMKTLYQYIH